jgi:hypothetical protein
LLLTISKKTKTNRPKYHSPENQCCSFHFYVSSSCRVQVNKSMAMPFFKMRGTLRFVHQLTSTLNSWQWSITDILTFFKKIHK